MAIKKVVSNSSSTDIFGNVTPGYRSNAGNQITTVIELQESIYAISSNDNPIRVDGSFATNKTFRFNNYAQINGFAVGQNVVINTIQGGLSVTTTITNIDYDTLKISVASITDGVTPIPSPSGFWFNDMNQIEIYSTDMRADLFFNPNFVTSSMPLLQDRIASVNESAFFGQVDSYRKSLIDGTFTKFYKDVSAMAVTDIALMDPIGLKSGSIQTEVLIERLPDIGDYARVWKLSLYTKQLGAIYEAGFHTQFSDHLNLYYDVEWYSLPGIINNATVVQWNENSNTGYFDEPYNFGTATGSVTQFPANELHYDAYVTNEIKITSSSPNIIMGACYLPLNDSYFKVKPQNQAYLCMFLNDATPLAATTYSSEPNPLSASYEIEVVSLDYTAGVHTVIFIFKPNAEFTAFMESNAPSDRRMIVWFQVGNMNHRVVFAENPLTKASKPVAVWDSLVPVGVEDYALWHLDKNTETYPADGPSLNGGGIVSIEDNIYLQMVGNLDRSTVWLGNRFDVIVVNTADPTDFFMLESIVFDWSNVFRDVNGVYQINLTQNISENLPPASGPRKRAQVRYTGTYDTDDEFTVTFICPLIINWRFWLAQANAFNIFYPNQNKNYINYDQPPYGIALRTTIESETGVFIQDSPIDKIWNYDEDHSETTEVWAGEMTIELWIGDYVEQVTGLIENEIMTIKVPVLTTETATINSYWGQITIEPTQNTPRWVASSNYANDPNPNNPFIPMNGTDRLKRTLDDANNVFYEIKIDVSKLNGANFSFTGKHWNKSDELVEQVRKKWNVVKTIKKSFDDYDDVDCCDFTQKVFAEYDTTSNEKNDLCAAWFQLYNGGSVDFVLYKNDMLTEFQPTVQTFPSQSNARFCQFGWVNVLSDDGPGCYVLKIIYTPAFGDVQTIIWGQYELQEYTREKVFGLVNLRVNFNSFHSIENIDFTNSNIVSSINIPGLFGQRKPKTEVDNNMYPNGVVEKVVNENKNIYTFTTNPMASFFTDKLIDLYFLSGNNFYITDNNFGSNHRNYRLKNVLFDGYDGDPEEFEGSKYAMIKANFKDKISDERSSF